MKAFYIVKRDGLGLWVKMYAGKEFAASCIVPKGIKTRTFAKEQFAQFIEDLPK